MAEWDESEHPRIPAGNINGGRFTEKQLTAAGDAAIAAAFASSPVEGAVMSRVQEIADLDHEELYAFDPQTGQQTMKIVGEKYSVPMDIWQEKELENKVFLHNHPGGDRYTRFSTSDLAVVFRSNAREAWVVAGDSVMVIRRPDNAYSWGVGIASTVRNSLIEEVSKLTGPLGGYDFDITYHTLDAGSSEVKDAIVAGYKRAGLDAYWKRWR